MAELEAEVDGFLLRAEARRVAILAGRDDGDGRGVASGGAAEQLPVFGPKAYWKSITMYERILGTCSVGAAK